MILFREMMRWRKGGVLLAVLDYSYALPVLAKRESKTSPTHSFSRTENRVSTARNSSQREKDKYCLHTEKETQRKIEKRERCIASRYC